MRAPLSCPSPAQQVLLCASFGPGGFAAGRGEKLLGKRVLIVEDEALLAFDLQLVFDEAGADVVGPALSLGAALALVESAIGIDCALLDVDLGGREVFPVAHVLQQRGVPFVFHTARVAEKDLAALFPGSVTVPKPAPPEDLVNRMAALLR